MTVAPGRLAVLLQDMGWSVASTSLLSTEYGFREILSWILGELGPRDL